VSMPGRNLCARCLVLTQAEPTAPPNQRPSGYRRWGERRRPFRPHKDWPKLRDSHLRESPFCVSCHMDATLVDHVWPRHTHPHLELERSNLQALCRSCHGKKTVAEGRGVIIDYRNRTKYVLIKDNGDERWLTEPMNQARPTRAPVTTVGRR